MFVDSESFKKFFMGFVTKKWPSKFMKLNKTATLLASGQLAVTVHPKFALAKAEEAELRKMIQATYDAWERERKPKKTTQEMLTTTSTGVDFGLN